MQHIRELVQNNQLKDAIDSLLHTVFVFRKGREQDEALSSLYTTISVLKNNHSRLELDEISKTIDFESLNIEKNKLIKSLLISIEKAEQEQARLGATIQPTDFASGIISKEIVDGYEGDIPGEVFAAELLTNRILLKKNTANDLIVTVNRTKVKDIVFSNQGKKQLRDQVTKEQREALKSEDKGIHDFILHGRPGETHLVELNKLKTPVRWLSGGALSIVEFRNRKWIPFFFRDILPYGWNISLGGSERSRKQNPIPIDEFKNPWFLAYREFLEETLILDGPPEEGGSARIRKFFFGEAYTEKRLSELNDFANHHIQIRHVEDLLELERNEKKINVDFDINIQVLPTNGVLKIISKDETNISTGVLPCINLLENGFEVVKVFSFKLNDNDYFLDGEILDRKDGSKELVRMPCAFISLDYLRDNLLNKEIAFNDNPSPSAILSNLTSDDIHLFEWDINRRNEILRDRNPGDPEYDRYKKWADLFGEQFQITDGEIDTAQLSTLFTPTSVKVLQYYFNLVEG